MTDADATPPGALQVYIFEDKLLPLREIEYDLRSAARLVGLSIWLGMTPDTGSEDQRLYPEAIDFLPVQQIRYGSPLTIAIEVAPYVLGYAFAGARILQRLMRGIGQLRKDYADASESNARRDDLVEKTETRRSERRIRESADKLTRFREAAEDLLRNVDDDEDIRQIRHLIRQATLNPESMEEYIDALEHLSEKTVDFALVPATRRGGDDDYIARA